MVVVLLAARAAVPIVNDVRRLQQLLIQFNDLLVFAALTQAAGALSCMASTMRCSVGILHICEWIHFG